MVSKTNPCSSTGCLAGGEDEPSHQRLKCDPQSHGVSCFSAIWGVWQHSRRGMCFSRSLFVSVDLFCRCLSGQDEFFGDPGYSWRPMLFNRQSKLALTTNVEGDPCREVTLLVLYEQRVHSVFFCSGLPVLPRQVRSPLARTLGRLSTLLAPSQSCPKHGLLYIQPPDTNQAPRNKTQSSLESPEASGVPRAKPMLSLSHTWSFGNLISSISWQLVALSLAFSGRFKQGAAMPS